MQRRTAALVGSIAVVVLAVAAQTAEAADINTPLGPRHEPGYFEFSAEDTRGHQEEDEAGEPRFLFTSTSLSVTNSTLIRAISAIIGALLLALPLYLAYATHVGGQSSGYGYGYGQASTGYGSSGRRFQRSASEPEDQQDLLNRLSLLVESSLRRHGEDLGMTEDGLCEALAACEAGAVAAVENNNNNTVISAPIRLHKILSLSAFLDRDVVSSSVYLNGLLSAHAAGHAGDSCGRYKRECLVASF